MQKLIRNIANNFVIRFLWDFPENVVTYINQDNFIVYAYFKSFYQWF